MFLFGFLSFILVKLKTLHEGHHPVWWFNPFRMSITIELLGITENITESSVVDRGENKIGLCPSHAPKWPFAHNLWTKYSQWVVDSWTWSTQDVVIMNVLVHSIHVSCGEFVNQFQRYSSHYLRFSNVQDPPAIQTGTTKSVSFKQHHPIWGTLIVSNSRSSNSVDIASTFHLMSKRTTGKSVCTLIRSTYPSSQKQCSTKQQCHDCLFEHWTAFVPNAERCVRCCSTAIVNDIPNYRQHKLMHHAPVCGVLTTAQHRKSALCQICSASWGANAAGPTAGGSVALFTCDAGKPSVIVASSIDTHSHLFSVHSQVLGTCLRGHFHHLLRARIDLNAVQGRKKIHQRTSALWIWSKETSGMSCMLAISFLCALLDSSDAVRHEMQNA